MKIYQIISPLIAIFLLFSCLDDESAYLPQEKGNIEVDDTQGEDTENEDEELPEGQLIPGMHIVKLNIPQPDGQTIERKFKYYMPISIDVAKPISLIFEFHGSLAFSRGSTSLPNPLNVGISNPLVQMSIKENCIICFPAGEVIYKADSSGFVNWQNNENNLPFVDAIVDYFKGCTPAIDANRIYSTGLSSGAIFSFVLAFNRPEVFAAIAPRAGQMKLTNQTEMPSRAVSVRVFAGEVDETVQHSAVIENTTDWAKRIGGYFESDVKIDTFTIENYTQVTTRKWNGGKADVEIYSLKNIGHGVSLDYCLPYMWQFMSAHTLNDIAENLYISSSLKRIEVQCSEPLSFEVNFTEGGTLKLKNAPEGWNINLEGNTVTLRGPKNFFGNIKREGDMTFTVTKNGMEASVTVSYKLLAPKDYFEIGDIYYNDNYEPVGVVCWVNQSNIREARIINLNEQRRSYYCGGANEVGLGLKFDTPDTENGYGNTKSMTEFNKTLTFPYTASKAAFMWVSTLTYKGVSDWYLPAINELAALSPYIGKINAVITAQGGVAIKASSGELVLFSSTTEVKKGALGKTIYSYNFVSNKIVENRTKTGTEYFDLVDTRAMKKVIK